MSQIIITGNPRFEDVKLLVEMLPKSDQLALRNYLVAQSDLDRTTKKKDIIDRFRTHILDEQQINQAVQDAIRDVHHAKYDTVLSASDFVAQIEKSIILENDEK